MNRKTRRILEKKLGSDFPIDDFLFLMEYYSKLDLTIDELLVLLLKKYVPIEAKIKRDDMKDYYNEVLL